MMNTAKVTVCFESRTKHSTQSQHHVEFFNFKPGGIPIFTEYFHYLSLNP